MGEAMKYYLYRVERYKEEVEDGYVNHVLDHLTFVWVTHEEFEEFSDHYACPEYRIVYQMMATSHYELDLIFKATKWELENGNNARTV